MSFDLILQGGIKIRHFAHIVSCAAKVAEAVSFEVDPAGVTVRGVSSSRSCHVAITIGAESFDHFAVTPEPVATDDILAFADEVRGGGSRAPQRYPFVVIYSKALFPSILKASTSPNAHKLAMSYDSVAAPGNVSFHVAGLHSLTKHYVLHLDNREYHRAVVDDTMFTFECGADGRDWLSIFAAFPPSAPQIHVSAAANRLALRLVDPRLEAHAATGDATHSVLGTTVSVESRRFSSYHHPQAPAAAAPAAAPRPPLNVSSHLFSQNTAPSSTNLPHGLTQPAPSKSLPGKTFECKPLRVFMLFAEAMHKGVRLRLGGPGVPARADLCARTQPGIAQAMAAAAAPSGGDAGVLNIRCGSLLIAAIDDASPTNAEGDPAVVAAPHPSAQRDSNTRVSAPPRQSTTAVVPNASNIVATAVNPTPTGRSSTNVIRASAVVARAPSAAVTPSPGSDVVEVVDNITRNSGQRRPAAEEGSVSVMPSATKSHYREDLGRGTAVPATNPNATEQPSSFVAFDSDVSFVEATRPSLSAPSALQAMHHHNAAPPPPPFYQGPMALDFDVVAANVGGRAWERSRSASTAALGLPPHAAVPGGDAAGGGFDFTSLMMLAFQDDEEGDREGSPWSDGGGAPFLGDGARDEL